MAASIVLIELPVVATFRQFWDWCLDGTLNTDPINFIQLFTIHAKKGGKAVPAINSLLPNKKSYDIVLKEVYILFYQHWNQTVLYVANKLLLIMVEK